MADAPSELAAEITELEQKHADNPEGRYLVALANAYRKAGNLPHAERLLREGLKRHPESLSAHVVLGRCLADRGATREAADEFRYVLSIDPQNLIALRTLGELAAAEGRTEESGRWYRELLAVDPMNEEARAVLESLREPQPSSAAWHAAAPEVQPDPEAFEDATGWWEAPQEEEREDERFAEASSETDLLRSELAAEWPDGLEIEMLEDAQADEEAEFAPAASGRSVSAGNVGGPEMDDYSEIGGLSAIDAHSGGRQDLDEDEVITETIADLYARQGFFDRAAGVYRELIRRGGDDPELRARLAEMEMRMEHGADAAPFTALVPDRAAGRPGGETFETDVAVEESEPGDYAEPFVDVPPASLDAFSASFAHGFDGDPLAISSLTGSDVAVADTRMDTTGDTGDAPWVDAGHPVQPSAEPGSDEPTVVGPSIAEYLSGLLSWVPGSRDPRVPEVLESPTGTPEYELPAETPEADFTWEQVTMVPDPALLAETGDADAADEWEPDLAAMPDDQMTPNTVLHAAPDEEELFPWELPAPAPTASAAQEEESALPPESFYPEEQPLEAPSRIMDYGDRRPPEHTGGGATDDDEDLESFQAWLRNLKR